MWERNKERLKALSCLERNMPYGLRMCFGGSDKACVGKRSGIEKLGNFGIRWTVPKPVDSQNANEGFGCLCLYL